MGKVGVVLGLGLFALTGSVRAQDGTPAPSGDTAAATAGDAAGAPAPGAEVAPAPAPAPGGSGAYPDEYALRPLTLASGTFQATVPVVLNLSKNKVLKPVWVPLDLRLGVNDQLELFISHNAFGSPLAVGEGGVCLGGTNRFCEKLYNNVNVGGQMSLLKDNGLELSGIVALEFRRLSSPMYLAVEVGVGLKYVGAPISIKAAPVIGIGANKRSVGNKEFLSVPVQLAYQASPQFAIFLDTGIFGPTSNFSDLYDVPVGIGASFLVQHGLDVGAEFMLPAAVASSRVSSDSRGFNARTLMVFAAYRTN